MSIKETLTKWFYVYFLRDYSDRIKTLTPDKKEIFINSYFRIRGQQAYGSVWILISFALALPAVFIVVLTNSTYGWLISILTLLVEVIIFYAVSALNKNFKGDLDTLMKILEGTKRRTSTRRR